MIESIHFGMSDFLVKNQGQQIVIDAFRLSSPKANKKASINIQGHYINTSPRIQPNGR